MNTDEMPEQPKEQPKVKKPKVLIFIVCYNAEHFIEDVLDRAARRFGDFGIGIDKRQSEVARESTPDTGLP